MTYFERFKAWFYTASLLDSLQKMQLATTEDCLKARREFRPKRN